MSQDFNEMSEGGGEELDVVAKYAYDSSLRQFKLKIIEAA